MRPGTNNESQQQLDWTPISRLDTVRTKGITNMHEVRIVTWRGKTHEGYPHHRTWGNMRLTSGEIGRITHFVPQHLSEIKPWYRKINKK